MIVVLALNDINGPMSVSAYMQSLDFDGTVSIEFPHDTFPPPNQETSSLLLGSQVQIKDGSKHVRRILLYHSNLIIEMFQKPDTASPLQYS